MLYYDMQKTTECQTIEEKLDFLFGPNNYKYYEQIENIVVHTNISFGKQDIEYALRMQLEFSGVNLTHTKDFTNGFCLEIWFKKI